MFTLVTDRSKYFRGQTRADAKETEEVLGAPFKVFFDGAIIDSGKNCSLIHANLWKAIKPCL